MSMAKDIYCSNPGAQYRANSDLLMEAISRVLGSGIYVLGDEVSSFEHEFAEMVGSRFCVAVNSGTDALILTLKALDIGHGDEVLTPSHTAVATVAAIVACGAIPVFVDVNPFTYTIDPLSARKAVTPQTRALIAVHLYGHPCDMDEIMLLGKDSGIHIVEDCAQAHGARWKGQRVGSIGISGCFSFYPTKNLGAIGDGGGVVSNDPEFIHRLRALRQYGWDHLRIAREPSGVSRLDEIQAAILRTKLLKLDMDNDRRNSIAQYYNSEFQGLDLLRPIVLNEAEHSFHLYVIQVEKRDKMINAMEKQGIYPGIHYPVPVHQQPAYAKYMRENVVMPITESLSRRVLSIPIYPELNEEQVERVVEAVRHV